jgi:hypothetical protein
LASTKIVANGLTLSACFTLCTPTKVITTPSITFLVVRYTFVSS